MLIILILKFGSSNILWLAMTVMVPLGNVSFALPFMPGRTTLHVRRVAWCAGAKRASHVMLRFAAN